MSRANLAFSSSPKLRHAWLLAFLLTTQPNLCPLGSLSIETLFKPPMPPLRAQFQHCNRCHRLKHCKEYLKTHTPLQDITEEAWNQPNAKFVGSCHECREKLNGKRASRREERRLEVNIHSWPRVRKSIQEKYQFKLFFKVNFRSINVDESIQISDLYRHLPTDLTRNDKKAVARYVIEQFAFTDRYQFTYNNQYVLPVAEKIRGRSSFYANAVVFRFCCSQNQANRKWISTAEYDKTRNRRKRIQIYDCIGYYLVIFPTVPEAPFDIVVENKHPQSHPGRDIFGVPSRVRRWIKENPRTTPQAQRDDLLRAISKGELPPVPERSLRPMILHYWWRKECKDILYISNDFWINMEDILRNHHLVSSISIFFILTLGIQCNPFK
jgi:hypothetical protein